MSKIPTLLAIFILTTVIGLLLFALNQVQNFTSGAQGGTNPIDVRITDITDTQAVITWLTDTPSSGLVNYSTSQGETFQSSSSILSTTHFILLQNLKPNTLYSFKINSSEQTLGNTTSSWQFQTTNQQLPAEANVVSGQILTAANLPAKNTLVYVTAGNIVASAVVSGSGNWVTTLPELSPDTQLTITAFGSPTAIASARVNLKDANPVDPITLGNSYNFTHQTTQQSIETPSVPIELP